MNQKQPILKIRNLRVSFPIYGGLFQRKISEFVAVDGIDLDLFSSEICSVVGESGSGKTTVGKAIMSLLHLGSSNATVTGSIEFMLGKKIINILNCSKKELNDVRSHCQMIFQDPFSSLNPRMIIRDIIQEPLDYHSTLSRTEKKDKVFWLLEKVGLSGEYAMRYPYEFSGGQRQRIGIARALALSPRILIADEPVSALDVSIQAQVLNLLLDLQNEFDLSILFIAHDLAVVQFISDRIAVMTKGNIVECAVSDKVFQNPQHIYTKTLLSAIPKPDPIGRDDRRQHRL